MAKCKKNAISAVVMLLCVALLCSCKRSNGDKDDNDGEEPEEANAVASVSISQRGELKVGKKFSVSVTLKDEDGNTVTSSTASVTLAIKCGDDDYRDVGDTVKASEGVAEFTDVMVYGDGKSAALACKLRATVQSGDDSPLVVERQDPLTLESNNPPPPAETPPELELVVIGADNAVGLLSDLSCRGKAFQNGNILKDSPFFADFRNSLADISKKKNAALFFFQRNGQLLQTAA